MPTIEYASELRRDYRRIKKNPQYRGIDAWMSPVIDALLAGQQLSEPPTRDHALAGRWAGYRELHLRADLLLIYARSSTETLRLVRLGSHADLFG